MTINVHRDGKVVPTEVIRKVTTGFRVTHNRDGRYQKMWAVDATGTVFTTNSSGRYRVALSHDVPPPALFEKTII